MTDLALDEFSVSTTTKIAEAVCRANGWTADSVRLLRLGQNATYRIQNPPLVLRVARTKNRDEVVREIAVARWLATHDYPATRVADDIAPGQPIECAGRFASIWKLLEESDVQPGMDDLAHLLRKLHALPVPPSLELPVFDPLSRIPERIAAAPNSVGGSDRKFLIRYGEELKAAYDGLTFNLAGGPIHSDAHLGNLLRATDGTTHLVDLEYFAEGPREWDLMLPAAYRYGFNWISAEEYDRFVSIYGYDVSRDPCFPVLRAIRELNMTLWIMQNVDHGDSIRAEFGQRVSDLKNPSSERHWKRF